MAGKMVVMTAVKKAVLMVVRLADLMVEKMV